jgi:prevent-host-death family protein
MEVGVRELKAKLSEYLGRAQRGEVITVTERGRAKALLVPVPGRADLERGVAEGWVTPRTAGSLRAVRRQRSSRRVLDVLGDDRGP